MATKRLDSVDVMRALAIIFMVLCHVPLFMAPEDTTSWLYFFADHIVGDFAAPFFLFLVGVSQVLSSQKETESQPLWDRTLQRGIAVFVVGLLFAFFIWGPQCIFDWDILTLIGFSIIFLRFCRHVPSPCLLLLCLALATSAPWLRQQVEFLNFWGGSMKPILCVSQYLPNFVMASMSDFEAVWTVPQILIGFFLVGYFPIIPWIIFPLLGVVVGRNLNSQSLDGTCLVTGFFVALVGIGGALLNIYYFHHDTAYSHFSSLSFYPNSTTMLLLQIGLTLLLFGILRKIYDGVPREGVSLTILRKFSAYSLTIYILHHILIFWPMWIAGWWRGSNYEMYYTQAMSTPLATILAVLFLLLLIPLLFWWDRKQGKYSLEWGLNKIVKKRK